MPDSDQGVDVLTVGEPLRAFVAADETLDRATTFRSAAVGAESNVAVALARLGHRAALVAAIGDDDNGQFLLRELRANGIDVAAVSIRAGLATGVLMRNSSPTQAISVAYQRRGSAGSAVTADQVLQAWQSHRPRLAHLSGITAMLSDSARQAAECLVELAGQDGVPVSVDINLRQRLAPTEHWRTPIRRLVRNADIVFGNSAELALLGDDQDLAIAGLVADGAIIIRKNPDLSVTLESSTATITEAALPASVVDPVGAGDALVAGFLSGVLLDLNPAERLRRGIGCAAFAVEHWSDTGGLPDGPALARRLSTPHQDQVQR